jgi:hypothetical protein
MDRSPPARQLSLDGRTRNTFLRTTPREPIEALEPRKENGSDRRHHIRPVSGFVLTNPDLERIWCPERSSGGFSWNGVEGRQFFPSLPEVPERSSSGFSRNGVVGVGVGSSALSDGLARPRWPIRQG